MKSVILDTNVLVSGIFWSGPPYQILNAWRNRKVKLIFSPDILDEYIRVGNILARKYNGVDLLPFLDLITIYGEMHSPLILNQAISPDPDDDKFIACALSANCKMIISGDKDLLSVSGYADITVCKPAEFVKKHLQLS